MEVILGVRAKLAKPGATDIDLLVHRYFLERPSPCVVVQNWVKKGLIGGHIESIEEVFNLEVAKHHEYVVKERHNLIAVTEPAN